MNIDVIGPQHPLFSDVIILGRQNAKTLGLFPEGAFRDHARKRFIYGAIDKGRLLGYILFRITKTKGIICIAHLCVRSDSRNVGVANKLLDAVKKNYSAILRGISLSCRRDYIEASKFWEKYGFKPVKTTRSRSAEIKYLVKWWYDFGNHDLFSNSAVTSAKISALLDANIIIKMRDDACPENAEAIALAADWLTDEADYYYAPEVFNEINRDTDLARAASTRKFVHTLEKAQFNLAKSEIVLQEISNLLPGESDNDRSDRKQLAESIAAGMEYFITLDSRLLDVAETIYEKYCLKILRPADFILFIDHDTKGRDYRSYRLDSPFYEYSNIQQDQINFLTDSCWLYKEKFEKKHLLQEKLTRLIAYLKKSIIRVVNDRDGNCIAYFGVVKDGNKLAVKLIRIIPGKISDLLFQQLIRDIIAISIENNLQETIIEDHVISEEREKILLSFGFQRKGDCWYKINISGQNESLYILNEQVVGQYWDIDAIIKKLNCLENPEMQLYKLELERKLWPVKFTDLDIPTYIIPIRPHWASQLFDHYIAGHSLFGAKAELSWSKDNIYYRSIKPVSEEVPGRILWYVSSEAKGVTGRDKSIVATSYLEEVHIGEAKKLFNKFKNYGIYEWKDIYDLAGHNAYSPIKALKFGDTEVFKKPVSLATINLVMEQCDRRVNTFASPVKVSGEIFNRIYLLGKQ
jgi:predicted nucleic acid-binding protein/GNAT superfamily N-acetyltransferase